MKLKAITLSLLAVLVLSTSSCGTLQRTGKDLLIVGGAVVTGGIYPVWIGAASDAHTGAVNVREGYDGGAWTEIVSFPLLFVYHGVKHLIYVVAHAVDIPATVLVRSWSEISANGPAIEPLDYYTNTWLDQMYARHAAANSVDANTGDTGK